MKKKMDELQAALLGSVGGIFYEAKDTLEVRVQPAIQQRMHPSELGLLLQVLPVCKHYSTLRTFVEKALIGENPNLYMCAIATAVDEILGRYEKSVLALESERDITLRLLSFVGDLGQLDRMIQQMSETAARTSGGGGCVLNHLNLPCPLPSALAQALTRQCIEALFRHIGHWVAFGMLLGTVPCGFFIEAKMEGDKPSLVTPLVPRCIKAETASVILTTGQYRASLGSLISREESLQVYDSLVSVEGVLHEADLHGHELDARIYEVRGQWSRAMWNHIVKSSGCDLFDFLQRMRRLCLCAQGDMWLKFIHATTSVLLDVASVPPPSLEVDTYPRKLQLSFLNCLPPSEESRFPHATLRVDRIDYQSAGPVEQAASCLLNRIKALHIQCSLGPSNCSYDLVSPSSSMKRYDELFGLHLRCKYVHMALHTCHRLLLDLGKRGKDIRRFQQILHDMVFFMDNFVFYLQVDVQDALYNGIESKCKDITTFGDAKALHDGLLRSLYERCYLQEMDKALASEVNTAMTLCLALYIACMRCSGGSSGLTDEVLFACESLSKKFSACLVVMYEKLSAGHRNETQSLLCRLDFNRWLSQRARVAGPS